MRLLAGVPRKFLAQQQWNEYFIILYSSGYEMIVLDHTSMLQSLPIADVLSASVNPVTGFMLVVTTNKVYVLEAITSFLDHPRWRILRVLNCSGGTSVTWLDSSQFVLASDSGISTFSNSFDKISETSVPNSAFLISDFSGMLFIYSHVTRLPKLCKDGIYTYLPHPQPITWCQFYQGFLFTLAGKWLRVWDGWQLRAACPATSPPFLLEYGELIIDGKKFALTAHQLSPCLNEPAVPPGYVVSSCGDGKFILLYDETLQLFQQTPTTEFSLVGEATGVFGSVRSIHTSPEGVFTVSEREKVLWDHTMRHRLKVYQNMPEIQAIYESKVLHWEAGKLKLDGVVLAEHTPEPEALDLKEQYAMAVGQGSIKIYNINNNFHLEITFQGDSAALSCDLLAVSRDGETTIYAVKRWLPIREFKGSSPAFFGDGYCVAADGCKLIVIEPKLDKKMDKRAYEITRRWNLPSPKTILDVSRLLRCKAPLYSPTVLGDLMLGDRFDVVQDILGYLLEKLRFCVVDEVTKSANVNIELPIEHYNLNIAELVHRLDKCHLPYLSPEMHQQVVHIAASLDEREDMDLFALAFIALKTFECPSSFSWAYHSKTKASLLAKLDPQSTWQGYASVGAGWWLEPEMLSDTFEVIAKTIFATYRDPVKCSLWYLALKKKGVLQSLWRISHGHPEQQKTMKLLSHDYSTQRWRNAAVKNAYALMGLHRYEYAAGLFLLGDSPIDACQTLARGCNDIQLAIAVARVYGSSDAINALATRYFANSDSSWLKSWALWETGSEQKACEILAKSPRGLLLYKKVRHLPNAVVCDEHDAVAKMRSQFSLQFVAEKIFENWEYIQHTDSTQKVGNTTTDTADDSINALPKDLQPAPTDLQLEPDMSAFDFGF